MEVEQLVELLDVDSVCELVDIFSVELLDELLLLVVCCCVLELRSSSAVESDDVELRLDDSEE